MSHWSSWCSLNLYRLLWTSSLQLSMFFVEASQGWCQFWLLSGHVYIYLCSVAVAALLVFSLKQALHKEGLWGYVAKPVKMSLLKNYGYGGDLYWWIEQPFLVLCPSKRWKASNEGSTYGMESSFLVSLECLTGIQEHAHHTSPVHLHFRVVWVCCSPIPFRSVLHGW